MSVYLTHLTRGKDSLSAVDVLIKILNEKKIRGSKEGFINGGQEVVCFQDAPIYGVSQNVKHEMLNRRELGNKIRYEPVGISIPKPQVFNKGGRPVIYEKPTIIGGRKSFPGISPEQLWKVVSLEMSNETNYIDWTHEREWRIKGDFEIPINLIYVILPDAFGYREFMEKADKELINAVAGIITLEGILY